MSKDPILGLLEAMTGLWKIRKSAPLSSDVHVPSTGGEDKILRKEHDPKNLGNLQDSMHRFLQEEGQEGHDPALIQRLEQAFQSFLSEEGVEKDQLSSQGREHIKEHNFALPEERKYPIHDIEHARNALARVAQHGTAEEKAKVQAAVYRKYPTLKKSVEKSEAQRLTVLIEALAITDSSFTIAKAALDVDGDLDMMPGIDNLEAGMLKSAYVDPDANDTPITIDMQQLVEGMDWELQHTTQDEEMARETALNVLADDPDHYRKLNLEADGTDNTLEKDTQEGEENPWANEGYNLDIGSGNFREPGHIGLDLYPYDHGTVVHDVHLGLPVPDESCKSVIVRHSLEHMDELSQDPKPLLSEIHRVLMPGGQFLYEGPNEIYNYPEWLKDYPGLVLTNHEDSVSKEGPGSNVVRQEFTRVATPDPATMNDAEPRVGVGQVDNLPSDALIAADALGYYYSDATSSGRGNRVHGYPSQGALMTHVTHKGGPGSGPQGGSAGKHPFGKVTVMEGKPRGFGKVTVLDKDATACAEDDASTAVPAMQEQHERLKKIHKKLDDGMTVPVLKFNDEKQLVYCVVLEPDELDAQDDFMDADDIEDTAHNYLLDSRVVGSEHTEPIKAAPVESFIAPQDFSVDKGKYGPQMVKKGSWVIGLKVFDPKEWDKVKSGEYTGVSVGGAGLRTAV